MCINVYEHLQHSSSNVRKDKLQQYTTKTIRTYLD